MPVSDGKVYAVRVMPIGVAAKSGAQMLADPGLC